MTVGICGTGKMGSAMAERLMEESEILAVWNRTPARAAPLIERGARLVASPAELARDCDVIIDMQLAGDILADCSGAVAVAKPRIPVILSALAGEEPGPPNFALACGPREREAVKPAAKRRAGSILSQPPEDYPPCR